MIITKIEYQKRNKSRVNLYADEKFIGGLSVETVMKNHIKVGQEINENTLSYLTTQTEKEVALNLATRYIAKSQKTAKEVTDHLLKKGFEQEAVDFAIEKMQEYGYVDDELYTKSFVKFKSKDNGKRKLKYALKNKGISEEIIGENLDNLDSTEAVKNTLEKYLKNKPFDQKTKEKAYRHLASRGFESGEIVSALNKYIKEKDDERWD